VDNDLGPGSLVLAEWEPNEWLKAKIVWKRAEPMTDIKESNKSMYIVTFPDRNSEQRTISRANIRSTLEMKVDAKVMERVSSLGQQEFEALKPMLSRAVSHILRDDSLSIIAPSISSPDVLKTPTAVTTTTRSMSGYEEDEEDDDWDGWSSNEETDEISDDEIDDTSEFDQWATTWLGMQRAVGHLQTRSDFGIYNPSHSTSQKGIDVKAKDSEKDSMKSEEKIMKNSPTGEANWLKSSPSTSTRGSTIVGSGKFVVTEPSS
jgi:hypothetical protein